MCKTILKMLKDRIPNGVSKHTIRWPSDIAVCKDLNERFNKYKLRLNENGITTNMQSDISAFESWALILKSWLEQGEDLKIELEWESPQQFNPQDEGFKHYQRFLYRVIRFAQMMDDWFKVSDSAKKYLKKSCVLNLDGTNKGVFLLNSRDINIEERNKIQSSKQETAFINKTEHEIEEDFYKSSSSLLNCAFSKSDIKGIKLMRQLPVGVFKGKVTNRISVDYSELPLFPGRKSAIDLWAIDEKKAVIFELKEPGNKKVGSISELLFYSNIVRDLSEKDGIFKYEKPSDEENKLKNTTSVDAYLLLGKDNIHPLLNNEKIFKLLNNAFKKRNQRFGCIVYNENLKCTKVF